MSSTLYTCACASAEHILILNDEFSDYLYLQIHLAPQPFFKRLVNGVRYIFGGRSKYGDFDEIIFTPGSALELSDHLTNWSLEKPCKVK